MDKIEQIQYHYTQILSLLGEDINREGLLKTPERVTKAMTTLTQGYDKDPIETLRSAMFKEAHDQTVLVKAIPFHSLCEHHLLPFFGHAHIAYLPNKYVTGLSKIARVVNIFSNRLQVQERLTMQISKAIEEALTPRGTMVILEAQHMCMQMRGVEKEGIITTTTHFSGAFNEESLREEILQLISHSSRF